MRPGGEVVEEVKRISLAERLGLPGSLPAQAPADDAAPTVWALWSVGPLAPAEGEEESAAPDAALGCRSVEVEGARRIHRNLSDLVRSLRLVVSPCRHAL